MASTALLPRQIMTSAPFRISFAGGGTDLPSFYHREPGAVLSCTIDKRVFVTVKRLSRFFGESYRLNYSETEIVDDIDSIKNEIARECLRLVPVDPPLYIGVIADIPTSSGLGASSSFAVSLLSALHLMRGERVHRAQLAEEAVSVEIEMLDRPIGKQDQYAAAFGGLNFFRFMSTGRVMVEAQSYDTQQVSRLFDSLLMFWTGISRDAGEILAVQNARTDENSELLKRMRDQAEAVREMTLKEIDIPALGRLMHEGWELKRSLSDVISSGRIDDWYDAAVGAGAYGGKLCGAGGGGFLLFVADPSRHDAIRSALKDLSEMEVQYEPNGVGTVMRQFD